MAIEVFKVLANCEYCGGENPYARETWHVRDLALDFGETLSETDAYQAVADESPTTLDVYGAGVFLLPRSKITVRPLSDNEFEATVDYGTSKTPLSDTSGNEAVDARTEFEITTRSVKMTEAIQTIQTYDFDGSTPGPVFRGLIGVTSDGVEGVETDTAVATFSHTVTKPRSFVTRSFLRALAKLIDKYPVNDASYAGYAAGELRIIRALIKFTDDGNVDITYSWAVQAATTADDPIYIGRNDAGGEIFKITDKEGWDYLWVYYKVEKKIVASKSILVRTPEYVVIDRIYGRGDYSILGVD